MNKELEKMILLEKKIMQTTQTQERFKTTSHHNFSKSSPILSLYQDIINQFIYAMQICSQLGSGPLQN